jgi:glycosyltransferase involved in cell wall biosynthesis
MWQFSLTLVDLTVLGIAAYVIWRFHQAVALPCQTAPRLTPVIDLPATLPKIAVIIPAYNEAINLKACVESVLQSQHPQAASLQVWIADDESTDATPLIAKALVQTDPRVNLMMVPPRPTTTTWLGKNWACAQAVDAITATTGGSGPGGFDYLLFIDADVRLRPGVIAAALTTAETIQADLVSCFPSVVCGCLAEWLAQPLIFRLLVAGFNPVVVNDPQQPDMAFAAGPFMLFRHSAYQQIGGHHAVAADLVEDVALARRIKAAGLKMQLMFGFELIQVRMYQNLAGLWEGWTKNLHMGNQRQLRSTLTVVIIALATEFFPWLGLLLSLLLYLQQGLTVGWTPFGGSALLLAVSLILFIWEAWLWQREAIWLDLPNRYGWLGWLRGLLTAAIALASIIKTETGWGWTWRGRSLVTPVK